MADTCSNRDDRMLDDRQGGIDRLAGKAMLNEASVFTLAIHGKGSHTSEGIRLFGSTVTEIDLQIT